MKTKHENDMRYTIADILYAWHKCYNENLAENYSGFIDYLLNMNKNNENNENI